MLCVVFAKLSLRTHTRATTKPFWHVLSTNIRPTTTITDRKCPCQYDFDLKEKNALKKPKNTNSNQKYMFNHHGTAIKHDLGLVIGSPVR